MYCRHGTRSTRKASCASTPVPRPVDPQVLRLALQDQLEFRFGRQLAGTERREGLEFSLLDQFGQLRVIQVGQGQAASRHVGYSQRGDRANDIPAAITRGLLLRGVDVLTAQLDGTLRTRRPGLSWTGRLPWAGCFSVKTKTCWPKPPDANPAGGTSVG